MAWNQSGNEDEPLWVRHAIQEIRNTYGDDVYNKGKSLNKFGRNFTVGTSFETVAEFQSTTANETFVSTNIIDSISSSDQTNDTGLSFVIEGHTIDTSGNLTFVSQTATLDGTDARTKVALTTPLARANRMYVKNSGTFDSPQSTVTGEVYVYDDTDGITAGVPDTAAATKLILSAGETQSEKCATSVSSTDYWLITSFGAGIGNAGGSAARVDIRMERRDVANGGVWRPTGRDVVLVVGTQNPVEFLLSPYVIIPKNHDWRIVAKSNANTASIFAEARGILLKVRG